MMNNWAKHMGYFEKSSHHTSIVYVSADSEARKSLIGPDESQMKESVCNLHKIEPQSVC